MLIKKLIQRLLDSRTTPSEAAHNAMPSSTPTSISSPTSITSWGTITTFTAPDDGYVTFHGRSMAGAAAQIASLPLENNPTVITATQDNYQGMSCNLPVVKGKTVEVYGSNIENIVVSFNRLIGGGYNILVRRALSCLRALSNCLPRSFCKANPNGLGAEFSQSQESLLTLPLKRTLHRAMDGLCSGAFPQTFWKLTSQSAVPYFYQVLYQNYKVVTLLSRFTFQSVKAKPSTCWATKLQTFCNVGLLRHQARHNLQTGGALC